MADRPEYKVYRSRRGGGLLRGGSGLDRLRERTRKPTRDPRQPREISAGRVLRWAAMAAVAWVALSLVLFVISAQLQAGASEGAEQALSGGGNMLTGSNILVLGSDARQGESIDKSQTGPARADSIMVLHAAFGNVRKLSIPRDAYTEIPGHSAQKINAAYALGGAGLMIDTVEAYLGNGLEVNHVVEVDFKDFPELIDALGGITVDNPSRICSPQFDNFYRGFRLPKGKVKVDGRTALGFARVRKNNCAPGEDDRDRAARQQELLSAIRRRLISPMAFLRLPLVSWNAPKTLETDMSGPSLMGLFTDMATGVQDEASVLEASCASCGPGSSLLVSEAERKTAVDRLLGR